MRGGPRLFKSLRDYHRNGLMIVSMSGPPSSFAVLCLPLSSLPAFSAVTIARTPGAALCRSGPWRRCGPSQLRSPQYSHRRRSARHRDVHRRNGAVPVVFSGPSIRSTGWPTTFSWSIGFVWRACRISSCGSFRFGQHRGEGALNQLQLEGVFRRRLARRRAVARPRPWPRAASRLPPLPPATACAPRRLKRRVPCRRAG